MAGLPSNTTPPTPQTQSRPLDHRRMSTPASAQHVKTEHDNDYARQTQSATLSNGQFSSMWGDMAPFATSLPPEAQQMVGPALDMNDPFQASLMQGSEQYIASPYYPWGDNSGAMNGMPVHTSAWKGMSATLAPAALATTPAAVSSAASPNTPASATAYDNAAPSTGLDFGFGSQETKGLNLQNLPHPSIEDVQSGLGSGQQTPGEGFWENFVQDATWADEAAA
jgi:hypothetical protein